MLILKTRLSRCAHVIDARRCAGVAGSSATLTLLPLASTEKKEIASLFLGNSDENIFDLLQKMDL
ncbi:hypothetical protein, partial [Halioxenophilus aromaticivorans]|uniref:Uncharacterized protein n=1 Tax=Halioxenophilus aromaticivorans TaxID=1306992 RepID=A0AAV3U7B9_9ALTE